MTRGRPAATPVPGVMETPSSPKPPSRRSAGGARSSGDHGLPRRVDHLGRIVVPIEIRRMVGIEAGDELEFVARDGSIILRPTRPSCVFCREREDLVEYRDRMVCRDCLRGSAEAFKFPT